MTINIFVLKGDLNGENRSGAFLFLLGILHTDILINGQMNGLKERQRPFL